MAYFNLSTNNGRGRIYILGGPTNATVAVSPDSITVSNGDSIVITMERKLDIFYASARDITSGSPAVLCSYQYDVTSSSNVLSPNTGVFDIATFGGNFSVDTINITSLERKQPNILLYGDSKMRYAMGWDCSVTAQLNRWFTNTINCSGEGDATADFLNHLPEVISIQPSTVILEAGRNDLGYGVSTGVWQANIDTIVARLQRAGITVWLVDAIYETFISQSTLVSFVQSTFPNNYIATFAAGQAVGATTVSSDQVHPTFLGAQVVAQCIADRMVISNNAKYVDGINDGTRLYQISFQNVNNYGWIRDPGATYTPAYNANDIVLRDGAAITAAYGTTSQSAQLIMSKTGTAATQIVNNLGGSEQAGGGVTVITPTGSSTGTQNQAFRVSNAGTLYVGAPAIPSTLTSTSTGWELFAIGKGIQGSNTNGTGIHGAVIPFSGTNFVELRDYWSGGGIAGYVSGGTADAQVLSFEAAPSANFMVGGLTVDSTAWLEVAAGTSTNAQIYLKPGTIMTTPKNGSLTHVNGHLWFTDQGTNYDLLASSSSVNIYNSNGTLTGNRTVTMSGNSLTLTGGNTLFTAGNVDIGGSSVPSGSQFTLEGNTAYFPSGVSGLRLSSSVANTNTDAATTGTSAANAYVYAFSSPTLAASNTGVTYPVAATVFINAAPTAGTNLTITNPYSLYVNGPSYSNGNITAPGNTTITFSHFVGNTSAPGIAGGSGAGSSPTVGIVGTDQSGLITITAGTVPSASATVATITYTFAYPTNSFPVLTPANSAAALLSGVTMVYTTGSTTNFVITSGTSALTSTVQYKWYYSVGGN